MWFGRRLSFDDLRIRLERVLATEFGGAPRTPPSDEYLNYRAELRRGRFRLVHEGDGRTTVLERTPLPDANPRTVGVTLHDSGRSLIAEARDEREGVLAEIRHVWVDSE
ncbi:hypothetical protein [Halogeometricum luteum]|uniref:Uncharacterized protein n=1 Tax=Halogeometricum luteum TaxID=2950537 RepID=A0ABU2G1V3_9EURY|nr:hypothetical protein [Halogeometricum sp. S3BR5-2]MDS0294765.1 hypothetical protein [Halogeometricum sp. S3BR5-2]